MLGGVSGCVGTKDDSGNNGWATSGMVRPYESGPTPQATRFCTQLSQFLRVFSLSPSHLPTLIVFFRYQTQSRYLQSCYSTSRVDKVIRNDRVHITDVLREPPSPPLRRRTRLHHLHLSALIGEDMSTVLPQGAGYGVVLGLGAAFALLMVRRCNDSTGVAGANGELW